MSQQKKYTGEVVSEDEVQVQNGKFNFIALICWIAALVLSLIPVYIELVPHLIKNNGVIAKEFWFACFKEYDVLWVFSTVLLFSLVNHLSKPKSQKKKGIIIALSIIGAVFFAFLEATWLLYKYLLGDFQMWPISLGTILIVVAMIVATPLQIDFIKTEG